MTPVDQLRLAVIRNARITVDSEVADCVVLEVGQTFPAWMGPLPRWLGARTTKKVALEGMALAFWRRIDDRATLEAHIDWLAADQQLGFNEARLITLQFLRSLAEKGLVVMGDRTLLDD